MDMGFKLNLVIGIIHILMSFNDSARNPIIYINNRSKSNTNHVTLLSIFLNLPIAGYFLQVCKKSRLTIC